MNILLYGSNFKLNSDILTKISRTGDHNAIYYSLNNDKEFSNLNNVVYVDCLYKIKQVDVIIYTRNVTMNNVSNEKSMVDLNLFKILEFSSSRNIKKIVFFSDCLSDVDMNFENTNLSNDEQIVYKHCNLYNISVIMFRFADFKKTTNIAAYSENIIEMFNKHKQPHFKINENVKTKFEKSNICIIENILFLIECFNSRCEMFEIAYKDIDGVHMFIQEFADKQKFTIEYTDSNFEMDFHEEQVLSCNKLSNLINTLKYYILL